MSVSVRLQYSENGNVLTAEFPCSGDPGPLKSGKRGWLAVSEELDWHYGWRLRVNCPITEPKIGYGYLSPLAGKRSYGFEEKYEGDLSVDSRKISVRFRIPDCLDPPDKKSFTWGRPILIEERMFHCALRLEVRARDGGHMRRRAATPERVGGIEFLSSADVVIGFVKDSETGRGREERVLAYCDERGSEYRVGLPYLDYKGRLTQNLNSKFLAVRRDAEMWVDAHPSLDE